jgi:hypothetical protein
VIETIWPIKPRVILYRSLLTCALDPSGPLEVLKCPTRLFVNNNTVMYLAQYLQWSDKAETRDHKSMRTASDRV